MSAFCQGININHAGESPQLSFNPLENSKLPEQLFKGMERPHQQHLSGVFTSTKSTDVSIISSYNDKSDEIMHLQNKDLVVQESPISEVHGPMTLENQAIEEVSSVSQKKGRQAPKKNKNQIPKGSPKKTPQSAYKNIYKAMHREALGYLEIFCKSGSAQLKKIRQGVTKLAEDESTSIFTLLKSQESFESPKELVDWLEPHKNELKEAIGDKRFAKFMSLTDLIQNSNGLINEKDCRRFFEEFKGLSLEKVKGASEEKEGKLLTWLLILAFSLVWLGEEDTIQFLPLQKDTVALFYWIINSKTGADGKCLLLAHESRKHIRNFLEVTFLDLFQSAWSQFADRHTWLASLAHFDPFLEKVIAKSTISSTAYSEVLSSFSPVEGQVQESFHYEEFAQKQLASLDQYEKISYDTTHFDYTLMKEKLIFGSDEKILTPQKLTAISFEGSYFQFDAMMGDTDAFKDRIEEEWSQDGEDCFNQNNQLFSLYNWEFQEALNGKRFDAHLEGNFEPGKKVKIV